MSLYNQQIGFAAGSLIATPTNQTGVQTPMKFGILQDVSLDMTVDLKELYGQKRFAIALAPGKTKIELKAKFAQISGQLFNDTFFGATTGTTQIQFAQDEAATVPGSSAYTVPAAHSGTFVSDEGVYYQNTGLQLAAASVAGAGTYSEAAGVYTFGSADASAVVALNYTYTGTGGIKIPITNPTMGVGPSFAVMLNQPFDGRQMTVIFNLCQASKLSFPTKQDDFTISEIDFMVAADASGNIGSLNTSL